MRRPRPSLLVPVVLLALAGCTAGPPPIEPDPARPSATTPSAAPAPDPEDVVVAPVLTAGGTQVRADVHPLVRTGEHLVLTVDLHAEETPDEGLFLASFLGATAVDPVPSPGAVRLLDLAADTAYLVALDGDGDPVATGRGGWLTVERGGTRLQAVYAAPPADVEALGLLLPGTAYVESVPVVAGDVPAPVLPAAGEGTPSATPTPSSDAGPAAVDVAPVVPLASYTRELGGAVATLASPEAVTITLGADVLFAPDSADLSPDAQAALDAAVAQLEARGPGTVRVVGHTDDVADAAYNQDLSERRARSVAAALATRVDAARHPLEVSGRGETEPVVTGTSPEDRARNRRVALELVAEATGTPAPATTGAPPPLDGPVATGPEGVRVEQGRPFRVAAPEARLVDGHVVVDLEVTALDEEVDPFSGVGFLSSVFSYRPGTWTTQTSAAGVTLLLGSTAVHPMDHRSEPVREGVPETWLPAADLETVGRLDGGQTRTYSLVYPEVGEPATVSVQVDGALGSQAFRLTDIPVRP
ncbi:OmpA family protein [Cellulomonas endophytica]|uniref:OmpA family protein n=1 Tax=Cellulomonas endophytica TaxID=2494735 RepID=UPI001011175C|nr:OmpA family protein [Cellulomonas endophytica]